MFSWDNTKAVINKRKHGVSFEEAASVFADVNGLDWEDDAHSHHEKRSKRLGLSQLKRILIVVYTVRSNVYGQNTIRVISARQASRKERKAYAGP